MRCDTPLSELATALGLAGRLLNGLAGEGVETVGELIHWYPRRWEDRTSFDRWPTGGDGEPLCLRARVADQKNLRLGGSRHLLEVTLVPVGDAGLLLPPLIARWFNLRWMGRKLPAGMELILWGRPRESAGRVVIDHPEVEPVEGDAGRASVHLGRIVPVYPLPAGLLQRPLRQAIWRVLEELEAGSLPPLLAPDSGFPNRLEALRALHFPPEEALRERAREALALEEFVDLSLKVLRRRREHERIVTPGRAGRGELLGRLLAGLPYEPTVAQRRSVAEIVADLARPRPMLRLLQGDVGSGKTLVAAAAAASVIEAGWQVALLAPTQILAEQHFATFRQWFEPLGVKVGLRTGSRRVDGGGGFGALFDGAERAPQLLVGTHALFEEKVELGRLGLVIVDEQHKFGVDQRERLLRRGEAPDLLVMTATPIPRTLTLTHYGDLDLSLLDEKPGERGRVVTRVRPPNTLRAATAFLKGKLAEGRQAYLVYPLVEDSGKVRAGSVEGEVEAWRKRLRGSEVGLLHGRMNAVEKEGEMRRFRAGELRALVTTTVVEVGVDVPNATVMFVWNAERFGLAQLHQLRGRIGRSRHTGYCVLFSDPKKHPEAVEKLAVLEATADGFALAEADLQLRGAGELLGTAQSGGSVELRLGDLVRDAALVGRAREIATARIDRPPRAE